MDNEDKRVSELVHSGSECLPRVACLWGKMPMFQRVGMKEGGLPLPPAFQFDSYDIEEVVI